MGLIDLEKGFYVSCFYSKSDYNWVIEEGPWIIMGHYFTVRKWKPNFKPSIVKITSTLVSFRISEVPLEYFNRKSLRRVGCFFGRVIKVDKTIVGAVRSRFARICVELDLSKPLTLTVCLAGVPTMVWGTPPELFRMWPVWTQGRGLQSTHKSYFRGKQQYAEWSDL